MVSMDWYVSRLGKEDKDLERCLVRFRTLFGKEPRFIIVGEGAEDYEHDLSTEYPEHVIPIKLMKREIALQ